jgi:hypothetical protein
MESRIRMYYEDHAPPHFQAVYQGGDAMIDVERLVALEGSLPNRALWLVLDWAKLPQSELRANWMRTQELAPARDN